MLLGLVRRHQKIEFKPDLKKCWCIPPEHSAAFVAAMEIVLVMDNLNTHSIASLYATFPPQYARDLVERLEIHYTPKHGSWLDIAEIELSALGRQCIADNRIPDLPSLRALLKPWATARNATQKGVDWHFTTVDARFKLKHLYLIINI